MKIISLFPVLLVLGCSVHDEYPHLEDVPERSPNFVKGSIEKRYNQEMNALLKEKQSLEQASRSSDTPLE